MEVKRIFVRALSWILSSLSAVVGFSAISVAIFGTLRARSKRPYVLLIIFYGAYTLRTFMTLLGAFIFSGVPVHSATTMRLFFVMATTLGIVVVAAAALYFHTLFAVKARRFRDIAVIATACAAVLLYSPPLSVSIDPDEGLLMLSLFAYTAGTIYLLLFAYLLVVGFSGSKRDWPRTSDSVSQSFIEKHGISQREVEVIALMDRGLSNPEIAEKLFVSLATVKTHAHNIYEETGAKSRYELFHMIRASRS